MAKFKANPTFMGILTGLTLALAMPTGWASAMYTFTTSGTAGDGRPDEATAVFDFTDANTLTITLTNDLNATDWGISSVLDGFMFTLSSSASAALDNVTPDGVLDCTAGQPPGGVANCTDVTATSGETSPYNWLLSSGIMTTFELAPNGYKPDGIVNDTIVANTDGISNSEHNNYLLGPVSFDITLAGLTEIPTITNVMFAFGTVPDWQEGSSSSSTSSTGGQGSTSSSGQAGVPEPSTLSLLGLGLLASVLYRRRRTQKV